MKFSALILCNLAKKIDHGYPVTALATANNYLDINCPLRNALVAKARHKIKFTDDNHKAKTLQKIFSGESIADCELSDSIRFYDQGNKIFCKKVPSKFGRISSRRRLSPRERTMNKNLYRLLGNENKPSVIEFLSKLNDAGFIKKDCVNITIHK